MISSLCFQSDTNIEMTAFPVFSMSCEQSEQLIFSVRRPEFQGGARPLFFEEFRGSAEAQFEDFSWHALVTDPENRANSESL
ncbi:MAG: hypothetical protein DMG61_18295 [Acidobacteria bacterium]|nr:MAG: hypothetical protein DMG61_18295 [Acidobacteriota bacterium]PYY16990.1 MAG: hypothetical protein DMG60_13170 [Acidobacteriota bacterium]